MEREIVIEVTDVTRDPNARRAERVVKSFSVTTPAEAADVLDELATGYQDEA